MSFCTWTCSTELSIYWFGTEIDIDKLFLSIFSDQQHQLIFHSLSVNNIEFYLDVS